jgi:membrane associated rhomboid family serine protease
MPRTPVSISEQTRRTGLEELAIRVFSFRGIPGFCGFGLWVFGFGISFRSRLSAFGFHTSAFALIRLSPKIPRHMGIYDRDYYREPARRNAFGAIGGWSVTNWLIGINVAVFLIDSLLTDRNNPFLGGPLYRLGYFSIDTAVFGLQVWRFVSLQFLHAGIQHIFFNMLALYFFGPIVEQTLGPRRYLAFYLLSGIASGLMFVILCFLHILGDDATTRLIGASGSIFGVLIAAAIIAPDVVVRIDFIFPIKLRTLAWLMVGFAVYQVVRSGENAGGEAAHIGGALMGFVLIKNPRLLEFANYRWPPRMRYRP